MGRGMKRAILSAMARRSLILALMFNLATLVPLPLSACAILTGLQGPCQCPMMMQGEGVTRAQSRGAMISCRCIEASAPIPKAEIGGTNSPSTLLAGIFSVLSTPKQVTSSANSPSALVVAALGPPKLRAQLCIFLL